jgi:hypothetical protein
MKAKSMFVRALVMACAVAILTTGAASAAIISYNFSGPSTQGWTTVSGSPTPYQYGAVLSGDIGPQDGLGGNHGFIVRTPNGDGNVQHTTMWVRSPVFTLDNTGPLSFYLSGGVGGSQSPTGDGDIASSSSGSGFMGAALRDLAGNFVLTMKRSSNSPSWEYESFTQAQLAPYVGNAYTLDLIDSYHGTYGWNALDTIAIPGTPGTPEPATVVLLGAGALACLAAMVWRRKSRPTV